MRLKQYEGMFPSVLKSYKRLNKLFFNQLQELHTNFTKMDHLPLSNGSKIPAVGLGTWQATDEELEKSLESAFSEGYRHIDTAFLYENENIIGRVLNRWIQENKVSRNEFFLTTKLPPMGNYPERVEGYLKASLNNLQVNYVDLYLIHCPDGIKDLSSITEKQRVEGFEMDKEVDHIALWKEMERQVKLGRTKAIGLSNFSILQIQNILKHAEIKPVSLQIELHLYFQQHKMVEFCNQNKIIVVAYSPLGSPGINEFYSAYGKSQVLPDLLGNSVVRKIAEAHGKTPAQILLRYTIQRGVGVIPKSSNPKRIRENIKLFNFMLSDEEIASLKRLEVGPSAKVGNWESWTWV